jgi:phenylalanyl-tRNA synthetase beta chain
VNEKLFSRCGLKTDGLFALKNPLSSEHTHLQNDLIPNLLSATEKNIRNFSEGKIFTLDRTFSLGASSVSQKNTSSIINGGIHSASEQKCFAGIAWGNNFLKVKGALEHLFTALGTNVEFTPSKNPPPYAHPGRSAEINTAGIFLGLLAELHPITAKNFALPSAVFFVLNLNHLLAAQNPLAKYAPLPRFPAAERDLCFVVSKNVTHAQLQQTIFKSDHRVTKADLFDLYEGEKVGAEKKSLAFHLEILDREKTLSEGEVETAVQKILQAVREIGGELRK